VGHQVLAHVVRSGFVESVHHGSAVALGPDGDPVVTVGDPDGPILPRSANKPLQAAAMLRAGLRLDGQLLALAAASHSGEHFHVDGVRRMLASVRLDEAALQNTAGLPLGEQERIEWQRAGRGPARLVQNCSGKHAAMLVTCWENGWPTDTYRSADHPLQKQILETVAELAGEPVTDAAVDGCGAPALALTLTGLARAFGRLARSAPDTCEGRVAVAVRRYPEWLGGTGRGVTRLVRAVPGLIAKDGAEAVLAAGLPDGRAVAVKIGDGAERATLPVLVELLRRLGEDAPELDELADVPVLGHGEPVGSVRPAGF
jgi:L-asparaginase II